MRDNEEQRPDYANADAARRFQPLKLAEPRRAAHAPARRGPHALPQLRRPLLAGRRHRGRGLGDLTRFYTYHEDHGIRSHARECYAELTAQERDWKDADLEAAREACHNKIDFASILPEVDRLLG